MKGGVKVENYKPELGHTFNVIFKDGVQKGQLTKGCPCKCVKMTKWSKYRYVVIAIDSEGFDRRFISDYWLFQRLTGKRRKNE